METTKSNDKNKTSNKTTNGNGGNKPLVTTATAATEPAPPATATKGTRGRKAIDSMTPEQLKEWKATHPSFMALVSYDGGKPNLDKSIALFKDAFSAYIAYRPTPVAIASGTSVPSLDVETLKKVEKIAADAFNKRAEALTTGGPRQIKTEAFLTFICQSLGIDPFEMEEKRKSVLRALTNSLGYEKVQVMITEGENKGKFTPAVGKHAALFLASEAVKS